MVKKVGECDEEKSFCQSAKTLGTYVLKSCFPHLALLKCCLKNIWKDNKVNKQTVLASEFELECKSL